MICTHVLPQEAVEIKQSKLNTQVAVCLRK